MAAQDPLPDRAQLIAELRLLRERGLEAVPDMDLPVLSHAARAAGRIKQGAAPQETVEVMLRDAVHRFGDSDLQAAAECTFGLAHGLKYAKAFDRRQAASRYVHVAQETFRKTHEKRILKQTAEGLLAACREWAADNAVAAAPGQSTLAAPPLLPNGRSPRHVGVSGRVIVIGVVAVVALVTVGIVVITHGLSSDAARLEAHYDGKDPFAQMDGPCAVIARSQPASPSRPALFDTSGQAIGTIELRTWPDCPLIWGNVLWHDNPRTTYQIPDGWTLQVQTHRPDTDTVVGFPEPASATPVPYAYSPLLATTRGCVYVEAYFVKGDQEGPHARTDCVAP